MVGDLPPEQVRTLAGRLAEGRGWPDDAAWSRLASLVPTAAFANSTVLAHPQLLWLGDTIPVPLPLGLSNVLSVGDLLIYAGALVLLHRTCDDRRDPAERSKPCPTPIRSDSRSSTRIAD